LPSVIAAEPTLPARPKPKRGIGALALLGCLFLILAIVALIAGGGGWYYFGTRQMEMRRARSVAEKSLINEYGNYWRIESESMSPGLNKASFEGKADPHGLDLYNRKFTIVVSKHNDDSWHIDD
jgi:hypothetical protein